MKSGGWELMTIDTHGSVLDNSARMTILQFTGARWLLSCALCLPIIAACSKSEAHFEFYPALSQGLEAMQEKVGREGPDSDAEVINSLALLASNVNSSQQTRIDACAELATLASPLSVNHLLQLCERAPEDWLRSQAAWGLGQTNQAWAMLRLLARLQDEYEQEVRLWIAFALAELRNYTGIELLWKLQSDGRTAVVRETATQLLQEIVANSGAESFDELWLLWRSGEAHTMTPMSEQSPRYKRAIWQEIAKLSFPNSDSASYVLANLGSSAAGILASALHDNDPQIRVGAARALAGMHGRASAAGPALTLALTEPSLAIQAACALGLVAYPTCEPILRDLLEDEETPAELRLACAKALGQIGLGASANALRHSLADGSPDLQQASAEALMQIGLGRDAADFLLAALLDKNANQSAAERTLEQWLKSSNKPGVARVHQEWLDQKSSSNGERFKARAQLLQRNWDQLKGL
ncbi:MAG: HEAT repeat protein [Planctomycetota bacterium]|jgi:HEAT repeat protein